MQMTSIEGTYPFIYRTCPIHQLPGRFATLSNDAPDKEGYGSGTLKLNDEYKRTRHGRGTDQHTGHGPEPVNDNGTHFGIN